MSGKITELTQLPVSARSTNMLEIVDVGGNASYKATPNFILGLSGNPVGDTDSQTLTNKALTGPTISGPVLSGTVTGTYTLGGTPTFPASVVTLTGSQTLTNKVLTSPTISSPTITNASITADAVSGFTVANNGTVYGMAITSGQHSGTAITNNTIDASKIKWSATGANAGIWWEEIGRTTLGSSGDLITVSSLPTRKYLQLRIYCIATGGTIDLGVRWNNDSTAAYDRRSSSNGAADTTVTGTTSQSAAFTAAAANITAIVDVVNVASSTKISLMSATQSASPPNRVEGNFRWSDATNPITRVDVVNLAGTGDFAIGSELVVLGHD